MNAHLLSTRDVNYLDLMGNGRAYRVPPYQRDYSWDEEQWEDLWLDIDALRDDPDKRHYLGALVVEAESDRLFRIIDGQQRLATLALLAIAVIRALEGLADSGTDADANRERARALRARFVGDKDPVSLTEQSKLTLNETDLSVFQDHLVQGRVPHGWQRLPRSNQLLVRAYQYFEKRIAETPGLAGDGHALASLLSETIARQTLFILITVTDDVSAYTVFETLNARGLELSTTDLLKNYLFSRMASPGDLSHLQRRWRTLVETVGQERFPDFLRYHLLCTHSSIRRGRLFQMIRDLVRAPADVLELLDALESRADLFAALGDPEHEVWRGIPGARDAVRELRLFRARQMTPLVFAAVEKLEPPVVGRVLRILTVVTFRYTVVARLNPNDLEPAYSRAARKILDGEARTASDVFALLAPIYVPDEKFQSDFEGMVSESRGPRRKITRYILLRLETDASGIAHDWETDPATIEHILPEQPSPGWENSIEPQRWDALTARLGNLLPLEAQINRRIGNALYADKLAAYPESGYHLAQAIPSVAPEEWSEAQIRARQARMAKRAVHLWRCDHGA